MTTNRGSANMAAMSISTLASSRGDEPKLINRSENHGNFKHVDFFDYSPVHNSTREQTRSPYFSSIVRQCKWPSLSRKIRELKQVRRERRRKGHLKSEFALFQTSSLLFHFIQFVNCWRIFLELNSKGLYLI